MTDVNHDTGFTIHITNTLQGLKSLKKPMRSEQYIFPGNEMHSHVEAIGIYNLILGSSFVLVMKKTFYVPSVFRNLVSVSRLVPFDFSFNISNKFCNVYYKYELVGNGTLSDGLFRLNLQNNTSYTSMHVHAGIKRCVINKNSSILWYQRLGHISIGGIKRLVNDRVLNT